MKLLVVSDIHSDGHRLNPLLEKGDEYQHVRFLGDGWRQAECLQYAYPTRFAGVRGNCDDDCDWHEDYVVQAGSVRILMTHGHRYGVRTHLDSLAAAAIAQGATVALYGHTHQANVEYVMGVLCVNPGHVCYPHSTATYCELEIDGDNVTPKIVKFD